MDYSYLSYPIHIVISPNPNSSCITTISPQNLYLPNSTFFFFHLSIPSTILSLSLSHRLSLLRNQESMDGGSWADQWDTASDPPPEKKKGGGAAAYGKKVGEKTKSAATTGVKKVKEGTAVGFQWIKEKYQKTTKR